MSVHDSERINKVRMEIEKLQSSLLHNQLNAGRSVNESLLKSNMGAYIAAVTEREVLKDVQVYLNIMLSVIDEEA